MSERIPILLSVRTWNITLRTAHIASMGVLLGGHAFDVKEDELLPWLWLTVGTGVALGLCEAGPRLLWFHQLRGLATIAKLVLTCTVPLLWTYRFWILLAVAVIASVASHMPARFRYYSVIYRKVIANHEGPGTSRLGAEEANGSNGESE